MTIILGAKWAWEVECDRAEKALNRLINDNPDKVEQARQRPQLLGWFVGRTAQEIGGTEHPEMILQLAKRKITAQPTDAVTGDKA